MQNKFQSISRIIKVAIKFINKFHPRYLSLLIPDKDIVKRSRVSKKDIFIITSCLNPEDGNNYHNHNPSHQLHDRLHETVLGIQSIRINFSGAYIILLDNSKVAKDTEILIKNSVDEYYNYYESSYIKTSRKHFNKGVPQFAKLVKFCSENHENYVADTFHFMSARYQLTANITQNLQESGSYFLYNEKFNNVSTRYYFFKQQSLRSIQKAFKKTLYCAIAGNSVEDALFLFAPDFKKVEYLGIKGMINGIQPIEE